MPADKDPSRRVGGDRTPDGGDQIPGGGDGDSNQPGRGDPSLGAGDPSLGAEDPSLGAGDSLTGGGDPSTDGGEPSPAIASSCTGADVGRPPADVGLEPGGTPVKPPGGTPGSIDQGGDEDRGSNDDLQVPERQPQEVGKESSCPDDDAPIELTKEHKEKNRLLLALNETDKKIKELESNILNLHSNDVLDEVIFVFNNISPICNDQIYFNLQIEDECLRDESYLSKQLEAQVGYRKNLLLKFNVAIDRYDDEVKRREKVKEKAKINAYETWRKEEERRGKAQDDHSKCLVKMLTLAVKASPSNPVNEAMSKVLGNMDGKFH